MLKNKNKKTYVYLVGSGPGDSELITLKAIKAIKEADVILYDRLISMEILQYAKANCELIDVGKKPNDHKYSQKDINELLISKAQQGKIVTRLKGGDPFVFGRGGEEALSLVEAGIAYEVIPGITSAIAVNTYAGIPITYRDISTSFHVITGNENPNKETSTVNYQALAQLNGTLVFLMGIERIEEIASALISAGKNPSTPAAVISWGCTAKEKKVFADLKSLADIVAENNIKSPGIITIGEVVEFGEKLDWRNHLPLNNKRVVITRAKKEQDKFKKQLLDLGAEVISYPTIDVKQIVSRDRDKINEILECDFILFSSQNGVEAFWSLLKHHEYDIRQFHDIRIIAIGDATKNALKDKGIMVDLTPREFTLEGVVESLKDKLQKGNRLFHVKGNMGRDVLKKELQIKGVEVIEETFYEVSKAENPNILEKIFFDNIDYIVFTSPSTAENFMDDYLRLKRGGMVNDLDLKNTKIAAIGPVTAKACEKLGLNVEVIPEIYTVEGLIEGILKEER